MDRTAVLERIEPILNYDIKNIEHTPRTRVAIEPDAIILRPGDGRRALTLAPEGAKSMAHFAGFPTDLAKQLHPDTFARVATELLERKENYSVTLKDHRVIAFGKRAFERRIDPVKVLRTIEASIKVEEYHRVMLPGDNSVIIDVGGERRQPVRTGDLVQAGASISFSPIGTIEPLVQSYVMRLVCTNGATTQEVQREWHFGRGGGEGDDIWQWFRQSVREAYRAVDRIVARWKQLDAMRISPEDRAAMLEAVLKRARITGDLAEAVKAEALNHPPETEYDVLNLITWASSHLLPEPRQIVAARDAAASYAAEADHRKVCPICRRAR